MLAKKFSAAWLELIPNYALRYDPCRTVTNSTVIVMQTYKLYCFSRSVSLLSLALLFGAWQNAAHRKTPSDLTARKKKRDANLSASRFFDPSRQCDPFS